MTGVCETKIFPTKPATNVKFSAVKYHYILSVKHRHSWYMFGKQRTASSRRRLSILQHSIEVLPQNHPSPFTVTYKLKIFPR